MRPITTAFCLFAVLFAACSKKEPATEVLKAFTVKGVVLRIENDGRTLVIDHEEMPGYMAAMTMPFRTKDPSEATDLEPGDEIVFTYQVAELSSWIEGIQATGKQVKLGSDASPEVPPAKLLQVGDPFPDFNLVDESGKEVELKNYRGSVVALTFIFTRCPVPEYCPAMMRNFKEVETLLNSDPNAPDHFQLLTVSFDSDYDTPEVMKAYGEKFQKSSPNWNLLGSRDSGDIKSMGEAVGLRFGKTDKGIYSHNLRTVVLDPRGRITKIFTDESWKPEDLVAEMKRADGKS